MGVIARLASTCLTFKTADKSPLKGKFTVCGVHSPTTMVLKHKYGKINLFALSTYLYTLPRRRSVPERLPLSVGAIGGVSHMSPIPTTCLISYCKVGGTWAPSEPSINKTPLKL